MRLDYAKEGHWLGSRLSEVLWCELLGILFAPLHLYSAIRNSKLLLQGPTPKLPWPILLPPYLLWHRLVLSEVDRVASPCTHGPNALSSNAPFITAPCYFQKWNTSFTAVNSP